MTSLARDVDLLAQHAHAKQPLTQASAVRSTSPQLQLHIAGNSLLLKPHLTYILGSAPDAHVHIGGADVAPQHAQITQDSLRPLQSGMPTMLNGRRMEEGLSAPLRQGDVIQLGSHLISVGTAPQQQQDASTLQRHEQTTAIPSAQTLQAGNINTHLLPSKHGNTSGYGGVYGQDFQDPDMDKLSIPIEQQQQGNLHKQDGTHMLPQGPGMMHEQHMVAPGAVKVLPDGTSVHNGGHPTVVEQVRPQELQEMQLQQPIVNQQQQQHPHAGTAGAVTGPALARLSAHQKPEYVHQRQQQPLEQVNIAQQPMTFASTNSGIINDNNKPMTNTSATTTTAPTSGHHMGSAAPLAAAAVAAPLAAAATHHHNQQQQQPQLQQTNPTTLNSNNNSLGGLENQMQQQHLGSGKAPAFTPSESLVSSAAIPQGTTTHHVTSGSNMTGNAPLASSTLGSGNKSDNSYVLAPAFSTHELSSILADMLDLSGSNMSPSTKQALPSLFNLFPPQERQGMNSGTLKKWLHAAQIERNARLAKGASSGNNSSLNNTGALERSTATAAGSSSTGSHTSSPADAGLAARALGVTSLAENEITESDLIFAILAMQAQQHGEHSSPSSSSLGSHGSSGLNSELGSARLASPGPLGSSSLSGGASGGNTDYALLTLLSDLSEMGGWRLSGGWEAAVRYMLDEQHMSRSRRSALGSSAQLKTWLRAAAAERDRGLQDGRSASGLTEQQQPVVGAPAKGDIQPIHLAKALIGHQHAHM